MNTEFLATSNPDDIEYIIAKNYDYINEQTFGDTYFRQANIIVSQLLDQINRLNDKKLNLLELGCGTCRISLQLLCSAKDTSLQTITAVDNSAAMIQVSSEKIKALGYEKQIGLLNSSIAGMNLAKPFDLAWCVFTVFNYITDEHELKLSLQKIHEFLKPGAKFICDVAGFTFFDKNGRGKSDIIFKHRENGLIRTIWMFDTEEPDVYNYEELCSSRVEHFRFMKFIKLRYYSVDTFKALAKSVGFEFISTIDQLDFTGSHFMIFECKK